MTDHIAEIISSEFDERSDAVLKYHLTHLPLMLRAKGSSSKHQAWEGGYYDHIYDLLEIAQEMKAGFLGRKFPFALSSALIVLYFHDIEKMFKYSDGLPAEWNKDFYLEEVLPELGIRLTPEELHAIKYVHGEGDDYGPDRVMSELAAFCHAADVLSARLWHSEKI